MKRFTTFSSIRQSLVLGAAFTGGAFFLFQDVGYCRAIRPLPRAEVGRMVRSFQDFIAHVDAHRSRMVAGAAMLIRAKPMFFEGVDIRTFEEYVGTVHDYFKTADRIVPEWLLKDYGRGDLSGRTIGEVLFTFYGRPEFSLTAKERRFRNELISKMNYFESNRARSFFAEQGMLMPNGRLTREAERIRLLEKVTDRADRGMDPLAVEEFARPMYRASQHQDEVFTDEMRQMAGMIERNYKKVSEGLTFQDFVTVDNRRSSAMGPRPFEPELRTVPVH